MSKIRSDSIWNSLPAEQREKMVHWLFVERIGYKEASERGLREFGVTGSETSVGRFYRRVEKERAVNDLKEVVDAAAEVNATKGTLKELRASAMKMTGMRMLEKAMANGDVKELAALGHVLTQCEEREIQRGRLALARKKFEFKAAKEAVKVAPLLNKMSESKQAQQDAVIVEAREVMFGDDPEGLYYEDWEELWENAENGEWRMTNDQGQMTKENPIANKKHLSPALVPTTASRGEGGGCAACGGGRAAGGGDAIGDLRSQISEKKRKGTNDQAKSNDQKKAPLPGPVASQARHKLDAPEETCAPRNVAPTTASRGEGGGRAMGCGVRIESSSAAGEPCVAAPEDGRTPKTGENIENSGEKSG